MQYAGAEGELIDDLMPEHAGQCQTDDRSNQTVAQLADTQQGAGSIASLVGTGANDLLVTLVVGGEASVLDLLRNETTASLDSALVVLLEIDHRLPAEGHLAARRDAVRQVLVVPLGTRSVHHQATAILVVVRVALMAPNGIHCKDKPIRYVD